MRNVATTTVHSPNLFWRIIFFLLAGAISVIIGMSPPTLHKYLAAHELLMLTCREKIKKKVLVKNFQKFKHEK